MASSSNLNIFGDFSTDAKPNVPLSHPPRHLWQILRNRLRESSVASGAELRGRELALACKKAWDALSDDEMRELQGEARKMRTERRPGAISQYQAAVARRPRNQGKRLSEDASETSGGVQRAKVERAYSRTAKPYAKETVSETPSWAVGIPWKDPWFNNSSVGPWGEGYPPWNSDSKAASLGVDSIAEGLGGLHV